jgi:hypothetical protein
MAGRKMAHTAQVGFIFLPAIFLLRKMMDALIVIKQKRGGHPLDRSSLGS